MNDATDKARTAAQYISQNPKRFYETVSVEPDGSGFGVLLDNAPVRTPLKRALVLSSADLAKAVAKEWDGQDEHINPHTMPLTRLANSAIDQIADDAQQVLDEITKFAGSDMLCYRADGPDELVIMQKKFWDPIIREIEYLLDAKFILINGINHHQQHIEILNIFTTAISSATPFQIAAMQLVTSLTGSGLLAYGLYSGVIGQATAWEAAHVDEDWQISQWGGDGEQRQRRAGHLVEFNAACRVFSLT